MTTIKRPFLLLAWFLLSFISCSQSPTQSDQTPEKFKHAPLSQFDALNSLETQVPCLRYQMQGQNENPGCLVPPEWFEFKDNWPLALKAPIFDKVTFPHHGIVQFIIQGDQGLLRVNRMPLVGYLHRSGRLQIAFYFDNGPDYFEEGRVRVMGPDGKIGLADHELTIIVPPVYTFVTPFKKGTAFFCTDCKLSPAGGASNAHDEHSEFRGGTWGALNRQGDVLQDQLTFEEMQKLQREKAR